MRIFFSALAGLALVVALGCDVTPEWPDAANLTWNTYEDAGVGYALEFPAGCEVEGGDGDVRIRYRGGPIVSISWTTRAEADQRGLWADHEPVGTGKLAGRPATLYRYRHYDGPEYMPTVSWVVKHRGKFMALELRGAGDARGDVPRRVVESFRFIDG